MKNKLIAAFLAASTALSAAPFAMAADEGDVEISFRVGDSILSINGVDTEVETPYIAGEGTTLVPLRVITEAFGAQVDWDGAEQKITLTYPDVSIVLQIGNIVAQVNDHSETLLEAPALSANGVTMVPPRFISETFGADVGYDAQTSSILVTKTKIDDSNTVVGITDMTRIGDSYYKWSMDTPSQMKMTDRSLDGLSTEFTADDLSAMYIDIYKYTEDTLISFDEEYVKIKDSFSSYTLTEAEKLTDSSGRQYMHFQAKSGSRTIDYREYYGDNYTTYEIISYIQASDDTSVKDMMLSLADSFTIGSIDDSTYDLSNVKTEGTVDMRTVKDDDYKVSFKVPASYVMSTSSDAENEFYFYNPESGSNAFVSLGIYSKSSTATAQFLAQQDHDTYESNLNPEFSTISAVTRSGNNGYMYTILISGSSTSDSYLIDSFYEKGDYVYNFAVKLDDPDDTWTAELITSSLITEELDSSVTGKLLRNDSSDDTTANTSFGGYTFDLSTTWKSVASGSLSSSAQSQIYVNASTGSILSVYVDESSDYTSTRISAIANSFKSNIDDNDDFEIVEKVELEKVNSKQYAHFTYSGKYDDGTVVYNTVCIKADSGKIIVFSLTEDDIYYKGIDNEALTGIMNTLETK